MNVVCPACSTRYKVPVEKLVGRRARLRCKRCSALIPLPQPASSPSAEAAVRPPPPPRLPPEPPAPSAAPRWTLTQPSGARQQMDTSGLVEAYRQGQIEPGALVWREGMDRWLPAYDVPEIAAALKGAGVTVPGSDLGAAFDDEEEATRVALSPLLPQAGSLEEPATNLATSFDDEVTRAIDSSPGRTFDAEEEPTRIYDPEHASALAEQVSPPHAAAAPSPPAAAPPPPAPPARSAAAAPLPSAPPPPSPPPARPAPPSANSAAPAPPRAEAPREDPSPRLDPTPLLDTLPIDDTSDISGLEEPLTRPPTAHQPTASLPVGPPTTAPPQRSRKTVWIVVAVIGLLLAVAVGVILKRPEWFASAQKQIALWLGQKPPADDRYAALPPFDTAQAGVLLEEAAATAQRCKLPDGPVGPGRVHIRYGNDGRARSARLSEPFADTEVGECVSAVFTKTRVAPFSGKEVIVAKTFVIE